MTDPQERELHLKDYWHILRKRQWTILAVFVIVATLGTIKTFRTVPVYKATAQILIEKENPNILSFQEVMELDTAKSDYYQTQYEILRSRALAGKVLDRLELEGVVFGTSAPKKGLLARARASLESLLGRETPESPVATGRGNEDSRRTLQTNSFLSRITIAPVSKTRLVDISAKSTDPKRAAQMSNALAEAYIEQNLEQKISGTVEAGQWLSGQLSEASRRLEESERALQAYKEKHNIVSFDEKQNFTVTRLEELNIEHTRARMDRIEVETRYQQLQRLKLGGAGIHAGTLPAFVGDPIILALKTEYMDLQTEMEEMLKKFTPKHPKVVRLQSQIDAMPVRIAAEVDRVIRGVGEEYKLALDREQRIQQAVDAQKRQAQEAGGKAIEYGALTREVENNRRIFETILAREKETGIAGGLRTNNIRMVDPAEVPLAPVYPNKRKGVIMAAILGLLGGIGLALFLEYLDDSIRDPEDLERAVNVPLLGTIPIFEGKSNGGDSVDLIALKDPKSPYAEAYRTVRTSLLFSSPQDPPKAIVVTSPGPQEGKTVTAVNLAITMANAGKKVLLIDADMRKPRVHKVFGMENKLGFSDILNGMNDVGKTLRKTPCAGLSVMTSGPIPANPSELLGTDRMLKVLEMLGKNYDRIILDCTPLIAVTDSTVAGLSTDGIILVVNAGAAGKRILRRCIDQLQAVRVNVIGTVLNSMDARRGSSYYSSYHYAYYRKYYGEDNGHGSKKKAGKKKKTAGKKRPPLKA